MQEWQTPWEFETWDTKVRLHPAALVGWAGLWGWQAAMVGRGRERSWPTRLLIGGLAAATWLSADMGHVLAHTVSARLAGAPMDEIRIGLDMPRTIYYDNDVSPHIHRERSLGGPIFNALGLATSGLLRLLARPGTLPHELAGWSAVAHGGLLAGSLAPLPIVDGGVILKWTLVERGRAPQEADAVVQEAGLATGAACAAGGVLLAMKGQRWPGLGLLAAAIVAIGAALGKIR